MKRFILTLFISSFCLILFGQINIKKTTTKIILKNEFGIPYSNTKLIFSSLENNYLITTNENGEANIELDQGIEFIVSCFINDQEHKFEEIIFIEENKNIDAATINLQFDLYESVFEIKNLNFETGKYEIQSKYFKELENLILLLKEQNKINIEIAGHTDSIGNDKANQILSEKRAISVKAYLVKNLIDSKRITCMGYGEKQPVESNKTEKGREKNRRIEIRILK